MTYPRYPDYKDSGVEWLGEVPGHWEVKRLKLVCRAFPSNVDKKSYDDQNPVKLCNYVDVYYNDEITTSLSFMDATASQDEIVKFTLMPGDTIITKDSETANDIAIAAYVPEELPDVVCGYHLTIVRPSEVMSGRFVKRLFDSQFLKAQFAVASNGLTRVGLSQYAIDNALFTTPPLPEQSIIVTFLDRETAKIDALVAEQQRLIELLKEKRQAVISHAVTKGLNPQAPMKDSGIDWLGAVPEHWERMQLGRICTQVSDGPHFSPNYTDEGILFISARNIKVDGWSLGDAKFISEEDYFEFCRRVKPEIGDVLYTKGGTTGIARVVDIPEPFQVWVHVAVLKIYYQMADSYFVAHALNSGGCYEQSQLFTRGATNNDLGLTRMVKIWLALPPLAEQTAIVAYLDDQTTKIDTLITEAERAIELLKEHRSALISAAVTGKIDVRGLVDGAAEAAQ